MSEAKKADTTLELIIRVIPLQQFFMKPEIFATTKGFKEVLLEDWVWPCGQGKWNWPTKRERRGDAFAFIEFHETSFQIQQVLKDQYDYKKTKDPVKATTKWRSIALSQIGMTPVSGLWKWSKFTEWLLINAKTEQGMPQWWADVGSNKFGKTTQQRYQSVIALLNNGKIGTKHLSHEVFIVEILGHIWILVASYCSRFVN